MPRSSGIRPQRDDLDTVDPGGLVAHSVLPSIDWFEYDLPGAGLRGGPHSGDAGRRAAPHARRHRVDAVEQSGSRGAAIGEETASMKVVLFCGGQGIRLREHSRGDPQADGPHRLPADPVARHALLRPLRPHASSSSAWATGAMRSRSTSCTTRRRSRTTSCCPTAAARSSSSARDIQDWRITFADTGLNATIGERLPAVRRHLEGEELFLANYGDTLTDAPLDRIVDEFTGRPMPSHRSCRSSPSVYPFRVLDADGDGSVRRCSVPATPTSGSTAATSSSGTRSSMCMHPGDELVEAPFRAAHRRRATSTDAVRGVLGADGHAARPRAARGRWPAPGRRPGPFGPRRRA